MDFYVVSPNASNKSKEEVFWKDLIEKEEVALMGWDSSNKFGKMFSTQVTNGDFILIAQGSNANKTLYLGGIVDGPCDEKVFSNAPRSIFYRQLRQVINKTLLDTINFEFKGSAWGEAAQIPAIYQLKPDSNSADFEIVKNLKSLIPPLKLKNVNMILPLLKYKKQIILQGPPGTGKTRLAKQLAWDLCQSKDLTIESIKSFFQPGLIIKSSSGQTEYAVLEIKENAINLQLITGTSYDIPLKGILRAYRTELWKGGQVSGNDPYRAALAKYISENLKYGEYKIIQFHPAYSYDDFVRGIVADITDGIVTYRSINKVFGDLAKQAWQNYQDSRKSPEQLSKEQEVDKYMELFRDYLEDQLEAKGGKLLLEGTTTYLFRVEEDAVRYTGDNWQLTTGQRLLFTDIKILFLSGAISRKDVKSTPGVSGLAKQHSSYFVRVLNLFKEFVKGKSVTKFETNPISEKNFVLIIDEINRANLPSVLGELIYGLEYRGEPVESMYEVDGSRSMVVPPNLYIIGTMNTADRSVGHIDYAIRRRFAFYDVLPSDQPIKEVINDPSTQTKALELFQKVSGLFQDGYLNSDFKAQEVQLGHSYFLAKDEATLKLKLEYEIKPLLKEFIKDGILNEKASEVVKNLSV